MQVDQDCFVKGEEDMVDSSLYQSYDNIVSNGDVFYSSAVPSGDARGGGVGASVDRATSGHAVAAVEAGEHARTLFQSYCSHRSIVCGQTRVPTDGCSTEPSSSTCCGVGCHS